MLRMVRRYFSILFFILSVCCVCAPVKPSYASLRLTVKADHILVYKNERKLKLVHGNEVIREYRIALGFQPKGHKKFEGDGKTPEGQYYITWKNPESSFYLSLKISYPNERDKRYAERHYASPGGMIMIHGLPNDKTADEVEHPYKDWTNGCIAVYDWEIREIWEMVDEGTPITIYP